MKKLVLLILLFCTTKVHADVLELIPGNSPTEKEIRWIWKYLPDIVKACAASEADCKDAEINKVVNELIPSYPAKIEDSKSNWGQELQFVSETARPDIFKSGADEEHRVAVTTLTKDAVIYINTDRMEMPISKWVGLLTHETIHHLGYPDDQTRLPDRVGAAIESNFLKISSLSTLEEFGHSDLKILTVNTNKLGAPTPSLVILPTYGIDIFLGPNERVPICGEGESFKGQNIGAILWRALRVRADQGIVKVKGSASVQSTCENNSTKVQTHPQTLFVTEFNLKFAAFDIKSAWWTLPSQFDLSTIVSGNTDSESENVDLFRTMAIRSIQHEKVVLTAGELWRSKVTVESLDNFVPQTCQAYMTGMKWSFHNVMDLPAVELSKSCTIKNLGGAQYEITLESDIPKNSQPDLFSTAWIQFTDGTNFRYAVPNRPNPVQVLNPNATPPAKVIDWRVLGLAPVDSIYRTPVDKSYRAQLDQTFWLEVDVTGSQKIGHQYIEFDELAEDLTGGVVMAPLTIQIHTDKRFIKSFEQVSIPGGTRLRYQMTVPGSGDLKLHGIKFLRFYSQTDDFSWVEYELPKVLSGFIVDSTL